VFDYPKQLTLHSHLVLFFLPLTFVGMKKRSREKNNSKSKRCRMRIKNAEVLNSKRIKQITRLLQTQWGYSEKLDCGFLQKENDIFLVTKDIDKIDLREVNVNSLGLYFGELRHDTLRLSIEGSQIIGKKASKNILELNAEQLQQWLRGEDMEFTNKSNVEHNTYLIIKHNHDFFGCGRIKEGKLLNFVPKARRMASVNVLHSSR